MNAVRALQRLQKAAKRRASQSEQEEQQEHRADHEEQSLYQEGGDEGHEPTATTAEGAVVLDMEGQQQQQERPLQLDTLGLGVPQHHVVKSVVELPSPPIISEAEEQGLDVLAHAMVADACAARAEAAEVRAAAADSDEADPDLRPLLMGLESLRATGAGDAPLIALPSSGLAAAATAAAAAPESVVESAPAVQAPVPKRRNPLQRRRVQHATQHSAQQGRKAVIMAKQQLVKTLTLSKHGETVEMELPIKELLRYIQGAVRTVHISQYPARGSIGGVSCVDKKSEGLILRDASGSVGASVGPEPPETPTLQRPRVFSHGSVASAAGGTRVGSVPVGGLLNARDVRRLISGLDTESVKSKEMSILVRRQTMVLNLDVIRCLVLWDRLIVVVPEGADSHCLQHLSENLRWLRVQQRAFDMDADEDEDEEFEFLALEAVLLTVCNQLKSQLKDLRLPIAKNSKALLGKGTLNTKHQDALRQLKSKVAAYQSKVRSLHRAIATLLDDEEHIQMLHLTRIFAQQQQHLLLAGAGAGADAETDAAAGATGAGDADRDDEAEVLLESFLHECSELIAKWDLVKEDMGNTENFCLMQLDLARNRLLTIGTLFALANLCFAFGSMIAGIYGMNLFNGVSEGSGSPNSLPFFIGVVSSIIVVMVVGGGSILTWMHQSRILVA